MFVATFGIAKVHWVDRSPDHVGAHVADPTREKQVHDVLAAITREHGRIDVLWNNAGRPVSHRG